MGSQLVTCEVGWLVAFSYPQGVKDYKEELSLGDTKRNVLYFSQSKYSRSGLLGYIWNWGKP